MDRTSNILILLIFLALIANLFQPLFFPGPAGADEPYQVAIRRGQLRDVERKLKEKVQKVRQKFDAHTHKIKICKCDSDVLGIKIETSKPKYPKDM